MARTRSDREKGEGGREELNGQTAERFAVRRRRQKSDKTGAYFQFQFKCIYLIYKLKLKLKLKYTYQGDIYNII